MAAKDAASAADRISACFKQLDAFAPTLNSVSDEFTKAISPLETALRKLKLGVPAWVRFNSYGDDGRYSFDQIGYDKIDGTWGIGLGSVSGHEAAPDQERSSTWLFNDAPRRLRVQAVDYLPELLEELLKEAKSTAEEIREKSDYVRGLTAVLPVSSPSAGRK